MSFRPSRFQSTTTGVVRHSPIDPERVSGVALRYGNPLWVASITIDREIERLMETPTEELLASADGIGRATRVESAQERYIEFAKRTLPRHQRLNGLRIVIDCAKAGYRAVAQDRRVLRSLPKAPIEVDCKLSPVAAQS